MRYMQQEGARLSASAWCLREGCLGLGNLPPPTFRPWGVQQGPVALFLWAQGVRTWGPITNRTAHALTCWLCALWGRQEGARVAGGASCLCEGCPGLSTLPPPTARPWGVRLEPAALFLWACGVRAWGPVTNLKAPALASWHCAPGRLTGERPGAGGGGSLSLRERCSELDTLLPPTAPS